MKPLALVIAALMAVFAGGVVACDKSDAGKSGAERPASGEPASGEPAAEDPETGEKVDAKALVAALADDEVSDERRLEAIHQARDAKISEATPALRELLSADNSEIVVAAAAALDGLDAKDLGPDIVEAASRLSRDHKFESLRQLLFIVGEVGGPQARIYLETVAEGHEVPGIRQTASLVLEEMQP
jgi:HEAT repeat protein